MTQATLPDAPAAPEVSAEAKKGRRIDWYRTPIEKEVLKQLNQRSDLLGLKQVLGYFGLYLLLAGLALFSFGHWHWGFTVLFVYLHGVVSCFGGGCATHELIHGNVFRTKWLNEFCLRVASLLSWWNHIWFATSHLRHHAYTLHPPDDLEVTLPQQMPKMTVIEVLKMVICNPRGPYYQVKGCYETATGQIKGEWNARLFPEGDKKRAEMIQWARVILAFHALVLVTSVTLAIVFKLWFLLLVPVLISTPGNIGGWLVFLCGMPQHYGLKDNVADFRMSTRSYTTNSLFRLLYWQMNYHLDHHMYPTVPCYRLKDLHKVIEYDLPPTPQGLAACWKEMLEINKKLRADPKYMHEAQIPQRTTEKEARGV